jgi:hypothetical protein
MHAKIFHLKSQKTSTGKLERLLRRHVYEDITVEKLEISDDYSIHSDAKEHERCRDFLRLFKASMIRVDDFTIVVADGKGRWYYMGGTYQNEPYLLELFHSSMGSVFPSIAIMGHLMMMPLDVGDAFEKSRLFDWFVKPRDLDGVLLTDFGHPDALEEGIRQAGDQLRTDIAKLCRRHMLARKIRTPDFEEFGRLLDVAPEYLEQHHDQIVAPSAKLSCSVLSGPVKMGADSEVALEVSYNSEEPLGRVCLYVHAPFEVLESPIKETLVFPGGTAEPRQIRFKVRSKTAPFCPLEALFTVDDARPVAAPFPVPLILDVQP